MDFYKYINSPDIAAHCREIKAEFNLLEKATIMHLSDADIIETLAVLRGLLSDEEDMAVPVSVHHDRIPSLKKWLRWSVEYIEQGKEFDHTKVDKDWSPGFLEDYYLHIPTPFKKGDIVCERYKPSDEDEYYPVDGPKYPETIFVLEKSFDDYAEGRRIQAEQWSDNRKYQFPYTDDIGDMAGHLAFSVAEDGQLVHDHIYISYTNLTYFAGGLEGTDRTCKYVSHFLRDEISMIELVGMQNIYLLEHLVDGYHYIESSAEYRLNALFEKTTEGGYIL